MVKIEIVGGSVGIGDTFYHIQHDKVVEARVDLARDTKGGWYLMHDKGNSGYSAIPVRMAYKNKRIAEMELKLSR
jgi:hypothetical protein